MVSRSAEADDPSDGAVCDQMRQEEKRHIIKCKGKQGKVRKAEKRYSTLLRWCRRKKCLVEKRCIVLQIAREDPTLVLDGYVSS